MRSALVAAFAASLLIVAEAQAAKVVDIQGNVLVDHGRGFRPISMSQFVPSGTRVMARAQSSATIVYDNGCREVVAPGAVATVTQNGACELGDRRDFMVGSAAAIGSAAYLIYRVGHGNRPASP